MPLLGILVAILCMVVFVCTLFRAHKLRRDQVNVRWDALDAGLNRRTAMAKELADLLLSSLGPDDPYLKELTRILDEEEPRHAPERRSEYQQRITVAFRRLAHVWIPARRRANRP